MPFLRRKPCYLITESYDIDGSDEHFSTRPKEGAAFVGVARSHENLCELFPNYSGPIAKMSCKDVKPEENVCALCYEPEESGYCHKGQQFSTQKNYEDVVSAPQPEASAPPPPLQLTTPPPAPPKHVIQKVELAGFLNSEYFRRQKTKRDTKSDQKKAERQTQVNDMTAEFIKAAQVDLTTGNYILNPYAEPYYFNHICKESCLAPNTIKLIRFHLNTPSGEVKKYDVPGAHNANGCRVEITPDGVMTTKCKSVYDRTAAYAIVGVVGIMIFIAYVILRVKRPDLTWVKWGWIPAPIIGVSLLLAVMNEYRLRLKRTIDMQYLSSVLQKAL